MILLGPLSPAQEAGFKLYQYQESSRMVVDNRIPVYQLVPPGLSDFAHKISGMLGNTSMACGSSLNNILSPEDGLLAL